MKLYTIDEVFIEETEIFPVGYTGMIIDQSNTKRWYEDGLHHREDDLPAIIYSNGDEHWYSEGVRHREGNPAIIVKSEINRVNGSIQRYEPYFSKTWYSYGKKHRTDGPAVEYYNGHEVWYLGGLYHREGGPAITKLYQESGKKNMLWYINNKLHRTDGPAIEYEIFNEIPNIIGLDGKERPMSSIEQEDYKKRNFYKLDFCINYKSVNFTDDDIRTRPDGTTYVELWFIENKKTTKEHCLLLHDVLEVMSSKHEKDK